MIVPAFLAQSAQRYPTHIAAVHDSRRITYQQLYTRAHMFSRQCRNAGALPHTRVALFMENGIEYIIGFFGILNTGAALIALAETLTAAELSAVLSDGEPHVIVTNPGHAETVSTALRGMNNNIPILVMPTDDESSLAEDHPPFNAPSITENDLAVILYTSGSTGSPKGVMLSHRNIAANADSIISYLGLTHDDKVMAVLPFQYSYGMSLLTTHVKAGGTLVIHNRFVYPNIVLDCMAREQVTGFAGVHAHYAILLRRSSLRTYDLPYLRYATQAGSAMTAKLINECRAILPHTALYVMYGQCEATARLSYLPPDLLEVKKGSIGKGMPGVELRVINKTGNPAAPGEIGEIVARGENIMMGYWHNNEETNRVLRNGWLYTGDSARVDDDGYIFIVGRRQDILKSGAHTISSVEIENDVLAMEGIAECAVIGLPDDILGDVIALYAVVADTRITEDALWSWCRNILSPYKLPHTISIISDLPKTSTGKVNKQALFEQATRA